MEMAAISQKRGFSAMHKKRQSTCHRPHGKLNESGVFAKLSQERLHMTMQAHLSELERKHRALEDEIADAMTHPSTDDLKIAELKRKKLLVKDEIERIRVVDQPSLH
jgi:hypothetical protein